MFPSGFVGQPYGSAVPGNSGGLDASGMLGAGMQTMQGLQPGMPTIGLAGMQPGLPTIGLSGMQQVPIGLGGMQGMQGLPPLQPMGGSLNMVPQTGFPGAGGGGLEMSGYSLDMGAMPAQFSMDADPTSMYYKTRMCTKWQEGRCHFGDTCKYAHGEHELRPMPGGRQNANGMGPSKKRAGDHVDLQTPKHVKAQSVNAPKNMTRPELWKTRLCDKFMIGHCPFGEACTYAHGQHELKPVPASVDIRKQKEKSEKERLEKKLDGAASKLNDGKLNKVANVKPVGPNKAATPTQPGGTPTKPTAAKPLPATQHKPAAAGSAKAAANAAPKEDAPELHERAVTVQWVDPDSDQPSMEKVVYLMDNRLDVEFVKGLFDCSWVELTDGTSLQTYRRGDLAGYSIHQFDGSVTNIQLTGRKS